MRKRAFSHRSIFSGRACRLLMAGMTLLVLTNLACSGTPYGRRTATPAPGSQGRPEYPIPPGLINTVTPGPTPNAFSLGSSEHPIVMAFVLDAPDEVSLASVGELARFLMEATDFFCEPVIYPTYRDMLPDMQAGEVHFAWLPPVTYLWAHQNNAANAVLLSNHFGVTQYGTQFLANVDSGFSSYFDPQRSVSSADAATALAQFTGYRPCWVDPTSISGYILPAGLLAENDYEVLPGAMTQEHTAVIRSLYVKGVCDFGVTYAHSGDPRTASNLADLPDVMTKIPILWRSDAVIPTLNLSSHPSVSPEMLLAVSTFLTRLSEQPEGQALLTNANAYDMTGLVAARDEMYDPLRSAVDSLGLDVEALIGE